MFDEARVISLTDAYIASYNRAFKVLRNPNLAVQVAMAVTMVLGQQTKNESENNLMKFFGAMNAVAGDEKEGEGDDA